MPTGILRSIALAVLSLATAPWRPDRGDGTYRNPVLYADYSDPDVVRVGDDFYLVASSFTSVPALPILHSRDLVNWTIVGHAAATAAGARLRHAAARQGHLGAEPPPPRRLVLDLRGRSRPRRST